MPSGFSYLGKRRSWAPAAPAKRYRKGYTPSVPRRLVNFKYPARTLVRPMSARPSLGEKVPVTFIYASKFSINPAAGGLTGVHVWNLTSLFDPDVTGVGHQPVNFDQFAAMFEKYQVYRCEVKVSTIVSASQQIFGASLNDFATTNADPSVYTENGQTQWKLLDNAGSGQARGDITMDVDIAACQGMTKAQFLADDVFRADFGTSPAENIYLHVWLCDLASGDPGASACWIELRFHAVLEGSKLNALS